MKVIIDIPEDDYKEVKEDTYSGTPFENRVFSVIANGIPLPKGHGRLIDADAYRKEMLDSREFDFFKRLDMQPTIIEADKKETKKESHNYSNNRCNQYKPTNDDDDFVPLFCDENIDCCDDW